MDKRVDDVVGGQNLLSDELAQIRAVVDKVCLCHVHHHCCIMALGQVTDCALSGPVNVSSDTCDVHPLIPTCPDLVTNATLAPHASIGHYIPGYKVKL